MADTKQGAEHSDMAHNLQEQATEAAGMPQLEFSTFSNQIFWLIIALVAIYLILTRVALPRIASILAERKGTITNDLATAEELKLQAQAAEEAYQQALVDARVESSRIAAEAKASVQADLDVAIAKADAEIGARASESEKRIGEIRVGAKDSIIEVAKDVAAEIVTVMGGSVNKTSITKAVNAQVKD